MAKRFVLIVLSCMALMIFLVCGSGCSSEEKKEPEADKNPPSEAPELNSQKPVAPAELEDTSAKPDTSETEQDGKAAIIQVPDIGSADKTPPAEIVLVQEIWETPTKSAVKFTHENHIRVHKIRCNECHHIYEEGENIWKDSMLAAKCEKCHDEPTVKEEKKLPPEDQKRNLKLAFHNNCRGCHKKVKKENPETKAPLKCSECHKNKE